MLNELYSMWLRTLYTVIILFDTRANRKVSHARIYFDERERYYFGDPTSDPNIVKFQSLDELVLYFHQRNLSSLYRAPAVCLSFAVFWPTNWYFNSILAELNWLFCKTNVQYYQCSLVHILVSVRFDFLVHLFIRSITCTVWLIYVIGYYTYWTLQKVWLTKLLLMFTILHVCP